VPQVEPADLDHQLLLGSDEIRHEPKAAGDALPARGLQVVMITGDARPVAEAVGRELGVDEVFAEVLSEDKACSAPAKGRTVSLAVLKG